MTSCCSELDDELLDEELLELLDDELLELLDEELLLELDDELLEDEEIELLLLELLELDEELLLELDDELLEDESLELLLEPFTESPGADPNPAPLGIGPPGPKPPASVAEVGAAGFPEHPVSEPKPAIKTVLPESSSRNSRRPAARRGHAVCGSWLPRRDIHGPPLLRFR